MSLRICIEPSSDIDRAGGVARVVEAQRRFLPQFDIQLVDHVAQAQVYIGHAGNWTKRDDIPRIANVHGLYWTEPPYKWPAWGPLRNAEIGRAMVEADMIVSPAEWVADIIRRDLWAPVNVIPNGIDPELIASSVIASPTSYAFWNKARVNEVCEIQSTLALAQLNPDREFVVTAPLRGSPRNVKAIGVVPYEHAIHIMRNAGLYLATTREVHGVSVLEAMACGVPVLGYAWGGQREQMTRTGRYEEGHLVTPGNVNELSEALGALSDPIRWKQSSEAAKERSKAFNWYTIMEGFAKDIHHLYGSWPGHRPANSPEISVVVPSYNLGKWLPRALSSVLGQKGAPPFEVIVVDDASTDEETKEVYRQIEAGMWGASIQVIRHSSNRFLAEALNTGIAAARGTWIVNLDPDNELPQTALHNLWRAAQRHPELDCVYGLMEIINEDGTIDTRYPKGIATYPPRVYNYNAQMRHENQVHSSAMFRRRIWERLGGYRQYTGVAPLPEVRLNSDAEFWTRAAALGFRFGRVLEEPTLRYRVLPHSMSHTVPDWDWTEPSPRPPIMTIGAPGGQISTHEPVRISVIVDGYFPETIVESLWPQTFDRWECLVVLPPGGFLPPYAKRVTSMEEAERQAKGKWIIKADSSTFNRFEPEALEAFYKAHADDPAGLYDVEDPALEGKVVSTMGCSTCGGGMRASRRSGPPVAARQVTARREAPPTRRQVPTGMEGLSGQMTFVEFMGSGFRTRYMHRMNPRTKLRFQYIFGNEPDHRRVLVYLEDVNEIIQNTQYRVVPEDELTDQQREQLQAVNSAAAERSVPGHASITISADTAGQDLLVIK